ncbi:MAG: tetratricopeptide repeat protein [Alphaproteobacteria bacterium]
MGEGGAEAPGKVLVAPPPHPGPLPLEGERGRGRLHGSALILLILLLGCATDPEAANGEKPSLREAALAAESGFDYRTAAANYRTLYAQTPDDPDVALGLARMLRYIGEIREATAVLDDATTRFGATGPLLLENGKLQIAMDRHDMALAALERARGVDPANWQVHSSIGVALDHLLRHQEAQGAYRTALTLAPDNPTILNNLALSLAQSGALDQALSTLDRAVHHPDATVQMRQNLALLKALRGDVAAAQRLSSKDLPPSMADHNAEYYRLLSTRIAQRKRTPR